jgi:hypothetical protein
VRLPSSYGGRRKTACCGASGFRREDQGSVSPPRTLPATGGAATFAPVRSRSRDSKRQARPHPLASGRGARRHECSPRKRSSGARQHPAATRCRLRPPAAAHGRRRVRLLCSARPRRAHDRVGDEELVRRDLKVAEAGGGVAGCGIGALHTQVSPPGLSRALADRRWLSTLLFHASTGGWSCPCREPASGGRDRGDLVVSRGLRRGGAWRLMMGTAAEQPPRGALGQARLAWVDVARGIQPAGSGCRVPRGDRGDRQTPPARSPLVV